MTEERGILRAVDWRSLLPWILLLRLFKPATAVAALAVATLTLALWPLGWQLSHFLFVGEDQLAADWQLAEAVAINEAWRPGDVDRRGLIVSSTTTGSLFTYAVDRINNEFAFAFRKVVTPVERLLLASTVTEYAYFIFGLLWSLIIWSFAGGYIARSAVVELGCDQREDAGDTLKLTLNRLPSLISAPLFPLIGVIALLLLITLGGLFMAIPSDLFPFLGSLLWWIALLMGVAIAFLLLGLMFGWPLMVPAAMAETIDRFDPFDPVSRAFSYTMQKPLHYLFYVVVSGLVCVLGLLLVIGFSEAVVSVTVAATTAGMGQERFADVLNAPAKDDAGIMAAGAGNVFLFWIGLVRLIAHAFLYSFFWCAAGGVYLLLRQSTDQTESDEVYFADEAETYALPPIDIHQPQNAGASPEKTKSTSGAVVDAAAKEAASASEPTNTNNTDSNSDVDPNGEKPSESSSDS